MKEEHQYTERATRFIVSRANQWNCSPKEAVARIIEESANNDEYRRSCDEKRKKRYSDSSVFLSAESRPQQLTPQNSNPKSTHTMSKRMKITDKREWLAVKDVEDIYGFSRWTLWRIMKEAKDNGTPIKAASLRFQNGSQTTRRQPFVRINKKSLDEYMEANVCEE